VKTKLAPIAIAIIMSTGLIGCANTQIANNTTMNLAAQNEAAQIQLSPTEAIEQATQALTAAVTDGLAFYAPLHIEEAQDKLDEAHKYNQKEPTGENQLAAITAAITVGKLVAAGEDNRAIVKEQLALSLDHRDVLVELGTPKLFLKKYNKGLSMLDSLIREIEGGFFDKVASDQPGILAYFGELEAMTLKEQFLTKAEHMLDKAEDANADDFAPITFEKAELALERASGFIDDNYREREAIVVACDNAYSLASQAYFVSDEAQKVFETDKEGIEQYVLSVQALFDLINQTAADDLASHSFYEQANILKELIASQNEQVASLQKTISNQAKQTLETPEASGESEVLDLMLAEAVATKENMVTSAEAPLSENVSAEANVQPETKETSFDEELQDQEGPAESLSGV